MIIDERIFNESEHIDKDPEDNLDLAGLIEMVQLDSNGILTDRDLELMSEYKDAEDLDEPVELESISKDTKLYKLLLNYFGNSTLKQKVRSYYENDDFLKPMFFWVHGVGYDYIDKDLLGGDGSGKTKKEFLEFINK